MISVLYVDDEPELLEIGKLFLEQGRQFSVDIQTSAQDGLARIQEKEFDAIISDYQMPGMDGITFLKAVRAKYGDLPFILFTGRGREEVVIEAINNGADFYLQKGGQPKAQFAELAHKVHQAVKRRKAEVALRASEDMYRTIFTTTGAATIIIDRDMMIALANEGFARLSGYSIDELEGKRRWTEFVVPEDLERMKKYHHDRRKDPNSAPGVYEFRFVDRQNKVKYCIVHVAAIPGTTRSVASVLDISDRVLVEQDYRTIIESIHDVFYRTDPTGILIRLSPSGAAVLGYDSVSELIGKSIAETFYFNPDDRNLFLAELEKGGGALTNFEVLLRKKDGTPIYALTSSHKYYDAAGNFGGIEGFLRDITDRKGAEEELRNSERRASLQRTAIAGLVLDPVFADGDTSLALKRVAEMLADTLGVARAGVWTLAEDGSELVCRSLYIADKKIHSRGATLKTAEFPRYFDALMEENRIYACDAQNDPRTSELAESYLKVLGITSMLDAGVFIGGRLKGVVCSEHIGAQRTWYPDEESFISTVAAIVAQLFLNAERRKAEESLAASESRFRDLTENSLDTIMLFDKDLRHLYVNPNVEAQTGIPPGKFIGKTHAELGFSQDLCGLWEQALKGVFETGKTRRIEFQIPSGIWIDWLLVPIHAPDGNVIQVITSARDITDRKGAEEALRESEERYRTLIETSPDPIIMYDLSGKMLSANAEAARVYGVANVDEFLSEVKTIFDVLTGDGRTFAAANFSRTLKEGISQKNEYEIRKRDGSTITIEINSSLVKSATGEPAAFISVIRDITERKRAEIELNERQEQFSAAFTINPDPLAITEIETGKIIEANPAFAQWSGYSLDELIQKTTKDLDFWVDLQERDAVLSSLRAHEDVIDREVRFRTRNGKIGDCLFSARVITIGGKEHLFTRARDITERKKAEKILKEREATLTVLLNAPSDSIVLLDRQGVIVSINEAGASRLGGTVQEITGRCAYTLLPPNLALTRREYIDRVFASGKPAQFDDERSGMVIHNEIFPIFSIDSESVEYVAIFAHDITERKRVLSALAEKEELYRKLVSTVPDIVVRTDLAGNIVYMNETGITMSGNATLDDVLDKSVFTFFSPEDLPRAIENTKLMFARQLGPIEYTFVSRDGNRFLLEINGDVLRTPAGDPYGMVYVGRDITGRKNAEEAIRRAHRQLALLSGITRHDILNNTTVILGFLALAGTKSDDPEIVSFLQKIEEKTKQIGNQIEFTRIYQDLGNQAPLWQNLHDVLMKNPVPQGISLSGACASIEVYADLMLEKVFGNLIDNSVRHGERVSAIVLSVQEEKGNLIIQYEDNGIGIPADEKGKIFERGYGKNTGLGLFLVREVLALTGITISENGMPGKGARFEMTIPRGAWRDAGKSESIA